MNNIWKNFKYEHINNSICLCYVFFMNSFFRSKKEYVHIKKYFYFLHKKNKYLFFKNKNQELEKFLLLKNIKDFSTEEIHYLLKILLLEKNFKAVLYLLENQNFSQNILFEKKNHIKMEENILKKENYVKIENHVEVKKTKQLMDKQKKLFILKEIEINDKILFWMICALNSQDYLSDFNQKNDLISEVDYQKVYHIFKKINQIPKNLYWLDCLNYFDLNPQYIQRLILDLKIEYSTAIIKKNIKKI